MIANNDLKSLLTNDPSRSDKVRIINADFDNNLKMSTYDFRVGELYVCGDQCSFTELKKNHDHVMIYPGDKCTFATLEKIFMPSTRDITGLVASQARLSLKGVSSISTFVDPNWEGGELLITIANNGSHPIKMKYGDTLCRVAFFKHAQTISNPITSDLLTSYLKDLDKENYKQKQRKKNLWAAYIIITGLIAGISFYFGDTNTAAIVAALCFFMGNRVLNRIERVAFSY
ncbi:hypothetical protein DND132_3141 [Pseudodesulfovibrio mercurii]|uniref:Uncharacterized protein n=1 Tax=Pseudodesulfovibrio mercurii TaxID=641491 RepID=F0JK95_9BACT|nr:hypothetical protein [Pseudodesulfovibrio mercurii]EGB16344.1 hypothetical protein DND132_3141 [Pseudodesulfovibrio mercurii]